MLTNFKCMSALLTSPALLQALLTPHWLGLPFPLSCQHHLKMNFSGGSRHLQRFPQNTIKQHCRTNTLMWKVENFTTKKWSFLLILRYPLRRPAREVRFPPRSVAARVPTALKSALLITQKCWNSPAGTWLLKDIDGMDAGSGTRAITQLMQCLWCHLKLFLKAFLSFYALFLL